VYDFQIANLEVPRVMVDLAMTARLLPVFKHSWFHTSKYTGILECRRGPYKHAKFEACKYNQQGMLSGDFT